MNPKLPIAAFAAQPFHRTCYLCSRSTNAYDLREVDVPGPHPGCAEFAPPDVALVPICRACLCPACGEVLTDGAVCEPCFEAYGLGGGGHE